LRNQKPSSSIGWTQAGNFEEKRRLKPRPKEDSQAQKISGRKGEDKFWNKQKLGTTKEDNKRKKKGDWEDGIRPGG